MTRDMQPEINTQQTIGRSAWKHMDAKKSKRKPEPGTVKKSPPILMSCESASAVYAETREATMTGKAARVAENPAIFTQYSIQQTRAGIPVTNPRPGIRQQAVNMHQASPMFFPGRGSTGVRLFCAGGRNVRWPRFICKRSIPAGNLRRQTGEKRMHCGRGLPLAGDRFCFCQDETVSTMWRAAPVPWIYRQNEY